MDNMIGKWLDNRYELLEVIGSGGMAVVYKAQCHRLNRPVAIKILKSDLAEDADFRRRFRDESQAVAMLSHPNIVSVYDVSRGEIEYIVMELIDGITLKQYMEKRGQLNWRESLHFITQIMKGLSHAHSRGIIHRDIKPQNIMVLRDGSVKVADFGIACLSNSAQTMTQEALGSVHYISPEQAKGNRTDARSDIYSAGVVLYEMLTSRLPFEGDSAVAVALQHLSSVPLPPREINPEVPEALEKICMKAMASDIEKRYASAEEMLADLEEFRKNPDTHLDFTIEDLRMKSSDEPTQYIPKVSEVQRTSRTVEVPDDDLDIPDGPIPRWLMITGIAMLCIAALFVVFSVFGGFGGGDETPTEFEVPKILGMTIEEAEADERIKDIFEIEELGQRYDSEYPAGQIIDQSPSAGSIVKESRKISVFVSSGIKTDEMPDLIGHEYRSAELALERLGLDLQKPVIVEEKSEDYTQNCVIRTIPAPGETLSQGDGVTLVVSMGPSVKNVTVTKLTGIPLDSALQMIDTLGLIRGSIEYQDNEAEAGTVIEQSIAQGASVPSGTVISFVVSSGPAAQETPATQEPPVSQPSEEPQQQPSTEEPTPGGTDVTPGGETGGEEQPSGGETPPVEEPAPSGGETEPPAEGGSSEPSSEEQP